MSRNVVVLPDPLGPRMEKNSPRLTLSDRCSTATVEPWRLTTPRSSTLTSLTNSSARCSLRVRASASASGLWPDAGAAAPAAGHPYLRRRYEPADRRLLRARAPARTGCAPAVRGDRAA